MLDGIRDEIGNIYNVVLGVSVLGITFCIAMTIVVVCCVLAIPIVIYQWATDPFNKRNQLWQ